MSEWYQQEQARQRRLALAQADALEKARQTPKPITVQTPTKAQIQHQDIKEGLGAEIVKPQTPQAVVKSPSYKLPSVPIPPSIPEKVFKALDYGTDIGKMAEEAKLSGEDAKAGALFALGGLVRFGTGFITGPAMLPATVDQIFKGNITADDIIESARADPLVTALNLATLGFSVTEIMKGSKLLTKIKTGKLLTPETTTFKYAIPLSERGVTFIDELKSAGKVGSKGFNIFDSKIIGTSTKIPTATETTGLLTRIKNITRGGDFIDIWDKSPTTGIVKMRSPTTQSTILKIANEIKLAQNVEDGFININNFKPKANILKLPLRDSSSALLQNVKALLSTEDRFINITGKTPTTTLLKLHEMGVKQSDILKTVRNSLKVGDGFIDITGEIPKTQVVNVGTTGKPLFVGLRDFVDELKSAYIMSKPELNIYGETPNPANFDKYFRTQRAKIPKITEVLPDNVKVGIPSGAVAEEFAEASGLVKSGAGAGAYPTQQGMAQYQGGALPNPYYVTQQAGIQSGVSVGTSPLFVDSLTKLLNYSPTSVTAILDVEEQLSNEESKVNILPIQLIDMKKKLDETTKINLNTELKPDFKIIEKPISDTEIKPVQEQESVQEPLQVQELVQEEILKPLLILQDVPKKPTDKDYVDKPSKNLNRFKVKYTFKDKEKEITVTSRTFRDALYKTWNKRGSSEIPKKVSITKLVNKYD